MNRLHRKVLLVALGLLVGSPAYASYWNVFNIEGESAIGADIVTYGSLTDMLTDSNRTSVNTLSGFGANIVGSGSDGASYWNVFNIEGESAIGADIVTYGSLPDMLKEKDRIRTELPLGRYRFGLLDRVALANGDEIDLWSARDALVAVGAGATKFKVRVEWMAW